MMFLQVGEIEHIQMMKGPNTTIGLSTNDRVLIRCQNWNHTVRVKKKENQKENREEVGR